MNLLKEKILNNLNHKNLSNFYKYDEYIHDINTYFNNIKYFKNIKLEKVNKNAICFGDCICTLEDNTLKNLRKDDVIRKINEDAEVFNIIFNNNFILKDTYENDILNYFCIIIFQSYIDSNQSDNN